MAGGNRLSSKFLWLFQLSRGDSVRMSKGEGAGRQGPGDSEVLVAGQAGQTELSI